MRTFGVKAMAAAALLVGLSGQAAAQWTVTNLHPATAAAELGSRVLGTQGGQQVGYINPLGLNASLWSGTAASWVNLNPAGAISSAASGVDNGQQVGWADFGAGQRAGLWTGTAASWIDLTPAGASTASAVGVRNGVQVGSAMLADGIKHGGYWTGTASSWVDLHPAGKAGSVVAGLHGGQQVGQVDLDGFNMHASLWAGTPDSWVDLGPADSTFSAALTTHNGQQVGYAFFDDQHIFRPVVWSGTAASMVDLLPAVSSSGGLAFDAFDGWQVGYVAANEERASLWHGTAESWEDLSLALPGSWAFSSANAVWHDGLTLYVAGWGFNNDTQREEALLWTRPVPTPSAAVTLAMAGIISARRRR